MNRTDADRWIRRGTAAAVLFVAAIAAIISFIHIRDLAATHGQTPLAAVLLPFSIDGTVAANVAYGAASGVTGALISGWPAYAFIGCAEMSILMVRRTARVTAPAVSARVSVPRKEPVRHVMQRKGVSQPT